MAHLYVGLPAFPYRHQPADRLIHHRLVIDGQKLLGDSLGDGVKTCAGGGGEAEAFHGLSGIEVTTGWR